MRVLVWLLRGLVFIALFGLAIKNSGPVDLRFYLEGVWQAPLSLVILAAFTAGAVVGLTVTLTTRMRLGRELRRLRGRLDPDDGDRRP
jgi:uncharacterized integral membrane protein